MRSKTIETHVTLVEGYLVKVATERAIMLIIDCDERWIARSLIEEGDYVHKDMDSGNISVAKWFADKAGLPY